MAPRWGAALLVLLLLRGGDGGAQEVDPEVSPELACFSFAKDETFLSDNQSQELCFGATTLGPVECFLAARSWVLLSETEAIVLCQCAISYEPVICYDQGRALHRLTATELLDVCRPIRARKLFRNCVPIESALIY